LRPDGFIRNREWKVESGETERASEAEVRNERQDKTRQGTRKMEEEGGEEKRGTLTQK
jgi:hypothetical protein